VRTPVGQARFRWLCCLAVIGVAVAGCTGTGPAGTVSSSTETVLTCQNSPGQQAKDTAPARLVNGVDGFIGDANAYDVREVWRSHGLRYLAWKVALAVAPGASPYRTVSVVSPASARLKYGPLAAVSRSVRLPVCGHRYTFFPGGFLVRRPACVTVAVTGPAGKPRTVRVPILVSRC
jgi:hypothetical protein